MCGIAGLIAHPSPQEKAGGLASPAAIAAAMADRLVHRGPDESGVWDDPAAGIALSHRRLSIIDLSAAAHQPMVSADGRYVLVYNGEIYNFAALRAELAESGATFSGHGDTEVLLAACARWGVGAAVQRLIGIFAFALWDRKERVLTLVRDRLGIKPLYWGYAGKNFLFASELKPFFAHPSWQGRIDRHALAAYLRLNAVPSPRTIYEDAFKLAPGCLLTLKAGGAPVIERYWDLRQIAASGRAAQAEMSMGEAEAALHDLLSDAVARQLVADVPVGILLSGGVDSATVAALAQHQASGPVKSFTIGFRERDFDEADEAARIAAHLGTDHQTLYASAGDALDLVPELPRWFDEPFGDSSQIPTYMVCRLARRNVTVALSGDGGDEMFLGYNRHLWGERLARHLGRVPLPLRQGMGRLLAACPAAIWDFAAATLPAARRPRQPGYKMQKALGLLGARDADELYRRLVSQWNNPLALMQGDGLDDPREGILWDASLADEFPDITDRMQLRDTLLYLPEDILTKVDRASMAVSLEARVPLLDHRIAEWVWRLPPALLRAPGPGPAAGKGMLRRVLARYVPPSLTGRPKSGFAIPLGTWLRGPLRPWAEEFLSHERLRREGYLNPDAIARAWTRLLEGDSTVEQGVWGILMFQAWLADPARTARTHPAGKGPQP